MIRKGELSTMSRRTPVEPNRMHGTVPGNPARGKAQGRIVSSAPGSGNRIADGSRSPEAEAGIIPGSFAFLIVFSIGEWVTSTKIIEADGRHERQVGPDRQKCLLRE